MRAIVITRPGGPEVLEEREVPDLEPRPGEVRVRVHAAGVNRADLLQRRGMYPAPPEVSPDVPGLEYAGTVEAVGDGVTRWRPGDRVMGLVGGAAYAESVLVREDLAIPVPDALSFEEAAAIPEAFITAHDALFTLLNLGMRDRLLIHAVGSGVGTAAIQLAREAGARIFGTSRSRWKLERAMGLGLELGIDPKLDNFAEAILEHTGGHGVHAILDLVGGPYLPDNIRVLGMKGRMAVVGLVAGRSAELDLATLLGKRLTLVGTSLRNRFHDEKVAATRAFVEHALPHIAAGRVRPVIDTVLPFSDVVEAHRRMESNENFGKIVLSWTA
jgi:NADPH:quinone reductase